MVKKAQKAKKASAKPSTSVKKRSARTKKENLSNGLGDNESEKTESAEMKTAENETNESSEEMDTVQENENPEVSENTTDSAKEEAPVELKDVTSAKEEAPVELKDVTSEDIETAPKSRKRKAAVDVKVKAPVELKDVTSEDIGTAPKSRKRKAAVDVKVKKALSKTKAKKQKVVLEVPKINSITGKVFVIGENDVGQLGLGEDITDKKRPALLDLPSIVDIAAGGMHSVCLTENGEVITFGCNDEGALGRLTTEEGSEYSPRKVEIPESVVQVSAGDSHSAALSESGQVYIWGNFRNVNGPMGLVTDFEKQPTPVKILNDVTVVKIASGSDHLACLSKEGVVFTCGCGEAGQLGRVSEHASVDGGRQGRTLLLTPHKVPVAKSYMSSTVNNIWTGSYTTFVHIEESGSIHVFGLNNYNQLGLEDQTTILKPMQAASFDNRTWLQIKGGQHHTLALDNNGLVYSLGRSEYGRLGLGENCDVKSVPTSIPSLLDKKCVDISCGNCVSFAVTDNGSVYSWGMGTNHQLGHGDDSDQYIPRLIEGNFVNLWKALKIAGGGQHTLILAQPRKSLEKSQ